MLRELPMALSTSSPHLRRSVGVSAVRATAAAATYVIGAVLLLSASVMRAGAQVPANEQWRTLRTRHFYVHFTRPLEAEARHAAAVAERAYANLAAELVRPRGMIDLVISDATDVSNGSATVFPRNQIVIYARPPVDQPSLESYDDWSVLVLQHETTHIFHLDRSRGIWSAAQHVFGRNPVLFPNYYTPAWLTEGLAVYYESRFTSGGRLLGSYQNAVARAAVVDRIVPSLDQLSLATSRFPYGESVYVYGSFVWDYLARRHGPESVPDFVERSSGATIPILIDREAKRTFGETFTRAWSEWRDSALGRVADSRNPHHISTDVPPLGDGSQSVYEVPNGGREIDFPRWRNDSVLVYASNTGRETRAVYSATLGGTLGAAPHRLGRRNTLDVNAPRADGALVFGQADFQDRFHTRGDLYVERSGKTDRLTNGARLSAPDVRADGGIIAVQTLPAATRLVRLAPDGRLIAPLTTVSADTQWAAPRWSLDGTRITAVRTFGGTSQIVTMDSVGGGARVAASAAAVLRTPAWAPSGSTVFYTSDEAGSSQLYSVAAPSDSGRAAPYQLTADAGGVYGVDVISVAAHPDSVRIAATVLRGGGFHVIVWTAARAVVEPAARATAAPLVLARGDPRWNVVDDSTAAMPYSPTRTLRPTYWSPTFSQEAEGRGSLIGALTSGHDAIGRHSYYAQADINTSNGKLDGLAEYSYNGLLNPVLSTSIEQSYTYSSITRSGSRVGDLDRLSRVASVRATFVRPRVRTYSAVTVGGELEQRAFNTEPGDLLPRLDPFYRSTHTYPALVASAVFSNVQRPTLSISPEDGVVLTASARQRWETGGQGAAGAAVAVASAYKSLDLPGFAHHVIALRAASGVAGHRSPSEYTVGGVNGSSVAIVPGLAIGSTGRTFPVRGFPPGSESGILATSVSAEYRVPLVIPSRGLGLFPLFLDKASLALFGDAARASCPARSTPACSPSGADGPTLAAVGAELDLDSALQFDVPYRFRFGLSHPVHGAEYAGASRVSGFVTIGGSF